MPKIGKIRLDRTTRRRINKNIKSIQLTWCKQNHQSCSVFPVLNRIESRQSDTISASPVTENQPSSSFGQPNVETSYVEELFPDQSSAINFSTSLNTSSVLCPVISDKQQDDQHFRFDHELRVWAVTQNIKGTAINSLLKLLQKHKCFSELPADYKSFLKTPRQVPITNIAPGRYCHFSLHSILRDRLKASTITEVSLQFNIDGLPISKSSSQQFWPILGHIVNFPSSQPFVAGIYFGEDKPKSSNEYLKAFVNDLKNLPFVNLEGERKVKVSVHSFVCDAPARAFILNIKSHTGYYGCHKCTVEGEYVNHRMTFETIDSELRTNQSVRQKIQEEHHVGLSSEIEKLEIDLVQNIPLDYQHLVCLGVVRKLINLWIKGKVNNFRLPARSVHLLSQKLIAIKYNFSKEFNRKPRSLSHLKNWKATEFRTFLLYAGPIVLKNILPSPFYEHFLALHVAVTILCSKRLQRIYLDYACELLKYFVSCFGNLYGQENITYNIHNLVHLASDSRHFGVLDNFSTFKFENYLGKLKSLIRSGNRPLEQVYNRIREVEQIVEPANPDPDISMKEFELSSRQSDRGCILKDGRVLIVTDIFEADKSYFIAGKVLRRQVSVYSSPCESTLLGIGKLSSLNEVVKVPSSAVQSKALIFSIDSELIVFPILHTTYV